MFLPLFSHEAIEVKKTAPGPVRGAQPSRTTGGRAEPRVVGRRARVLDVPDVPAELVEAAQVVDRLPRHACHRVLPEDAEDEERLRTTRHGPAPPRTGCGGDARTARRARRAPRTCPARRCARRRGPGSRPPAGPSRAGAR